MMFDIHPGAVGISFFRVEARVIENVVIDPQRQPFLRVIQHE